MGSQSLDSGGMMSSTRERRKKKFQDVGPMFVPIDALENRYQPVDGWILSIRGDLGLDQSQDSELL